MPDVSLRLASKTANGSLLFPEMCFDLTPAWKGHAREHIVARQEVVKESGIARPDHGNITIAVPERSIGILLKHTQSWPHAGGHRAPREKQEMCPCFPRLQRHSSPRSCSALLRSL